MSYEVVNFVEPRENQPSGEIAALHGTALHCYHCILPYSFNNTLRAHVCTILLLCILTGHYRPLSALPLWLWFAPLNALEMVLLCLVYFISTMDDDYKCIPIQSNPKLYYTVQDTVRAIATALTVDQPLIKMACTVLR